jgi:diguanylate cyclase (GGDEF)-like protein
LQLKKFKFIFERILSDPDLEAECTGLDVFRLSGARWYDEADKTLVDSDPRLAPLQEAHQTGEWTAPNSEGPVYFPTELEAVVAAVFTPPAGKPQLTRFQTRVNARLISARWEFEATHDQLTGLADGLSFVRIARDAMLLGRSAEESATQSLMVIAVDVDHFKQINDSYGHAYGDVTLQCVADKLEWRARQLAKDHDLSFVVSRPGGEEFSVMFLGRLETKDEMLHIANSIRHEFDRSPTPSNDELTREYVLRQLAGVDAPLPEERRVTISLGVSSSPSVEWSTNDLVATIEALRVAADTALACAKAAGRNTVCHYDDILTRHGRVLEHHKDTGIVAIDLGSNVGAEPGMSFAVFHPDFAGGQPFTQTDGRTRRTLGFRPKIEMGRIHVLHVQPLISFCRVQSLAALAREFPVGAPLEAIDTEP